MSRHRFEMQDGVVEIDLPLGFSMNLRPDGVAGLRELELIGRGTKKPAREIGVWYMAPHEMTRVGILEAIQKAFIYYEKECAEHAVAFRTGKR